MNKHAAIAILAAALAFAGEWVTTEDGRPVCRLTTDLYLGMVIFSQFCIDWQPGFPAVHNAQPFPFEQKWIRLNAAGGYQIHVEDRWVP